MFDPLSRIFAIPLQWFYGLVGSYGVAITLITVLVMVVLTPLTLKSTKGMLEMQLLQPELRKLQQQHRGDRQKLNEEMMKLYQEHKVNPLASCLPLLAQMPVFIGMFHLLRGLTQNRDADGTFAPRFVSADSKIYQALDTSKEMLSFGLDLSRTPRDVMAESFGKGLIYALLVVALGVLYWVQQRMIASRTVNPTMSVAQQKMMQYLPVLFAPFQLFFPTGLVLYYLAQTVLRIAQQAYVTRRFYHGDEALGRRAQVASQAARDAAKSEKSDKSGSRTTSGSGSGRRGDTGSRSPGGTSGSRRAVPPTSKRATPPSSGRTGPPSRPQRPAKPNNQHSTGSRHPKPKKP